MKSKHIPLIFAVLVLTFFSVCAIFPDLIAPYTSTTMFSAWQSPSSAHLLGTNDLGYDVFSEIVYSTKNSLINGVLAAFISLFIGTALGFFASYPRKSIAYIADTTISIFLLIPLLPTAIVVSTFCGDSSFNILLIIALLSWCTTARSIKLRSLQLWESSFVENLTILGVSRFRIVLFHILPNLWELIVSRYIMTLTSCIMLEATLSFLGIGNPLSLTWGRIMMLAYKGGAFTRKSFAWLIAPGVCISLVIFAFYCLNSYYEQKNTEVSSFKMDTF